MRQLLRVRSFPQGINNCYTFKQAQAKGSNYLIQAIFMYGNYDSKENPPEFGLYLEGDEWDMVTLSNASDVVIKEIIHVPMTDYIHVCLVNTGSGTPFISALELRQLNNTIYKTHSGSLALQMRLDVGSTTTQIVRYKDDVYDRIWKPYSQSNWDSMTASYNSGTLNTNGFKPPSSVMMTAARPPNGSKSLDFVYHPADSSQKLYLCVHFASLEGIKANQLRIFKIYLNGESWHKPVVLGHLLPYSVYSKQSLSGTELSISITVTDNSTLPPVLNAMEIYMIKDFSQSPK
ncbi:putative leucine-rich repeat receptor-like protein kinase At2g19210 [Cornus florida]|uniref:putative leucine-rich repeat receptor-like protein kinase At2g19210 n=1 Tax=Cornus florida TaxID=4283 RepID=UPI0028981A5B|nr:putative leucine-rich repeat receptor-like protein kinase At2g19210 [Cornus florida]